ncbi:hypothetical protein BDN70DRAFT_375015 [Pholiota conissans]|uniref:Uncharacterized protein n=1 Tax=Pholiota conissans TaxID=109636 RepID=A0A9P5Z8F7_9AGAR|nr:hypothetical protein BDN70DRAFT_375015 [Pholiota conissans]
MSITTTTTTTTTSIRVDVFPAPPPTINSLDREERSRLLRSTRKLEAVLGTAPIVVEMTPRRDASPKAARREGSVYHQHHQHSRSSSFSSESSSEPDYVLVKSTARSSPYQLQSLPPPSHRSEYEYSHDSPTRRPDVEKTSGKKRKGGASSALPPIALVFDIPGGSQTRSGSAHPYPKGRSAQPLVLFRARPVPERSVAAGDRHAIKTKSSSNGQHGRVSSKPLSPISSTFNMNMNMNMNTTIDDPLSSPALPSTPTPPHLLNDTQKRRKLAKLARTLGENIPPELVFHDTAPATAPRRSLSISHHHQANYNHARAESMAATPLNFQRPSKYEYVPPPLAVAETPVPPAVPRTSTSSDRSSSSTKSTKRRHRPGSLTLGSSSAIAAATAAINRGTASLVAPQPAVPKKELAFNSTTLQPIASVAAPDTGKDRLLLKAPTETTEFGRRKEREWSGEWNLKDMDDVARRLRGLKGR